MLTFHFVEFVNLKLSLEIVGHFTEYEIKDSFGVLIIGNDSICNALLIDDEITLGLSLW